MYSDIYSIVASTLGSLISVVIVYHLLKSKLKAAKEIELKSTAYFNFITKALAHGHNPDKDSLREVHESVGSVVLSGKCSVINEMSNFYRHHGKLDSIQADTSFAKIISEMRKDIIGNDDKHTEISLEDIILLIIGKK